MNKKEVLLYGALTAALIGCTVYVLLPFKLKLSYILDDAHLATELPKGTFARMICPNDGSELTQTVIIHSFSDVRDAAWRVVYYCGVEDIFWICNYPGGIGEARWYGPFNAYLRWTNLSAICSAALSGTALVLIALRKTFYK